MKKNLLILVCLLSFISNIFSQDLKIHHEPFKGDNSSKSTFNLHEYNPLMDNYDLKYVKLDLEVTNQSKLIFGSATIEAVVIEDDFDQIVLQLEDLFQIDSIIINGQKTDFNHENDEIVIDLTQTLPIYDLFRIIIYYRGVANNISRSYSIDWGKNVVWTLSESFHAYEWWPCKQVLWDKIDSADLYFTTTQNLMVGSNGVLKDIIELEDNKHRFEWESRHPINYYLISFAVSDYTDYSFYTKPDGSSPILVQNYVYDSPGCLNYYKSDINETGNFINLFSELFGLYPFADEKYGHCLTQLGGGMEHQTMTTIGNFGYDLVSHELAHQWYGDYVTCATWQDIWINEGFASYSEYIARENLVSFQAARDWISYAMDRSLMEPEGSLYIPIEDASNESRIFSWNLSYKKGAVLLHMLRHEFNDDDLFYASLRGYLNDFKDSVATGDDFIESMNQHSGKDFTDFFNAWYYGKGYPTFISAWSHKNDTLKIDVSQHTSSSSTELFPMHIDFKALRQSGDTILRFYHDKVHKQYKVHLNGTVTNLIFDPNQWILHKSSIVSSSENINHSQFMKVEIFPNPAKDFFIIRSQEIDENTTFRLYSITGRLIKQSKNFESHNRIDIRDISSGIYIVELNCSSKTHRSKLIVE